MYFFPVSNRGGDSSGTTGSEAGGFFPGKTAAPGRGPAPVLRFFAALTGVLSLTACIATPQRVVNPIPLLPQVEEPAMYRIVNHKNEASGQDIPEWLRRYLAEGIAGIEAMRQFENVYAFVGMASGTNMKALEQWAAGFTAVQDLPRLVADRVQSRFIAASGSPDAEYGRYFEQAIKGVSDIRYTGARKEADFWVLKHYPGEDGETPEREVYEFYVLVTTNRANLMEGINTVLNGIQVTITREQSAAVARLRERFYDGF
jgi:hypothetical protein